VAGRRVVVVDDDRAVRTLIAHHLKPPHFELHAFARASEALARLPEIAPDLIVSDIMMPDMDGRDFFRQVRQLAAEPAVPFIFLTAIRSAQQAAALREAGADDYLVKPLPISHLVEKIRNRLGPEPEPEGRAEPGSTLPPLPEPPAAHQGPKDLRLPRGRFSSVDIAGRRVQVLTEVQPGARYTVVTVVAGDGRGVCRIETTWRNPLRRAADFVLAARQLDFEHERTIRSLHDLVSEGTPRREVWPR
jgi:CheY-like chemotaxis protein